MYTTYWQLAEKPFENGSQEAFYFASEAHQGALLKLRYAIENRRGGGLLAGGSGLGKTMLVQMLRRELDEDGMRVRHLVFPQMTSRELIAYIAAELGADELRDGCEPGADVSVRFIQQQLRQHHEEGLHDVLVIDEAHLLAEEGSLELIRLLLNFEIDGTPALSLLLVGQTGLLPAVDRNPGLEERLGVKCLLRPLNLEETIQYVNHRLSAAGARREIFSHESLERLFHLTHGKPRKINRLCDLALLIGYAEEQQSISAHHIESVSQELIAVAPE
ncbi:MAG: AAA family ATPase [Pirellulales bacterium]